MKASRQDYGPERAFRGSESADVPLPPDMAALCTELASLARAVTAISERLDQDCASARMAMRAPEFPTDGDDRPGSEIEAILSAASHYAAADLGRIYPRVGVAIRALRALAEKYGS